MKWQAMNDIDDNELINLLPEDEENVKNILYDKYGYLIDVILKKYTTLINTFGIDYQEIYCEASYGFSDGINSFAFDKNASLKTFLSLCVERRVTKYLSKCTTQKYKMLNDTLSLDNMIDDKPMMDFIKKDSRFEPLNNLTEIENLNEIIAMAKDKLSSVEFDVFKLMLNGLSYKDIAVKLNKSNKQIDNAMQRVKQKLYDYVKEYLKSE